MCAQITSNPYGDAAAIALAEDDCLESALARVSYIRPGKLFTIHESLFLRVVTHIREDKLAETARAPREDVFAYPDLGRHSGRGDPRSLRASRKPLVARCATRYPCSYDSIVPAQGAEEVL